MDIVVCPGVSLPFATLHWTGNDGGLFNRELKRLAAFRGFHLSNSFLCRADREHVHGRNVGEIARSGACIECAEEVDIFAALGVPYRPPALRRVDPELIAAVAAAAAAAPASRQAARAALTGEEGMRAAALKREEGQNDPQACATKGIDR